MKRIIALATAALIVVGCATIHERHHDRAEQVIRVTAKKFEYTPNEITVKKGVPVVLEITSLDRHHGFQLREFGVRADINPGEVTCVRIVPDEGRPLPVRV